MVNAFALNAADNDDPARRHYTITPSNDEVVRQPRALYCRVAGDVSIEDAHGVALTYSLLEGEVLTFAGAVKILPATTATLYGWE